MSRFFRTVLVLAIGALVVYKGYQQFGGGDSVNAGVYINKSCDFNIKVPSDWRVISEEEAISCRKIREFKGLDNRLHLTPTNPEEAAIVLSVLEIEEESYRDIERKQFVDNIKRTTGMNIKKDVRQTIGPFTVHRIGGNHGKYYNEMAYFASGGRVIQIVFWCKESFKRRYLSDMDGFLKSLDEIR